MPLFDFLLHKTERQPLSTKAPATTERVGVQKPLPPVSHELHTLLGLLSHSEIARACIAAKTRAMQDPRLMVQQLVGDTYEEIRGHPLRRLFMRPMPDLDEPTFLGIAIASIDIAGVFFAEKIYSNAGALVGLNPINPVYMQPRRAADGSLAGYTYKRGTYRYEFDLDELLIRDTRSWCNPTPLATAAGAIDLDRVQTDFARAFFNNAGQPAGILKKSGIIQNEEEADRIRAVWSSRYGRGSGGWGLPAVFDDNMSYERVGSFLNELDNDTLRRYSETRICMAFGVPPLIIYAGSGLDSSTYSNLKVAWANFWDSYLSPTLSEWRVFLTWHLLPEFVGEDAVYAEEYRLEWDLSKVAALQEDVTELAERARVAFQAGGITLNEYRGQIGMPPDDAGDYYVRTLAVQPVPQNAALLELTPAPELATRRGVQPEAVKTLKAASTDSVQRQLERAARSYVAQQYQIAVDAVRQAA